MTLQVRLFAHLVDLLATTELSLEVAENCTVQDLEQRLRANYPALQRAVFRIAVDQAYAQPDKLLSATSEVALLPPVSGG